jgi:Na+-driven multidrug efflux pump
MNKNNDLTQGSVSKQLISFGLPILAASFIQLMYSTVDVMFVGRYLGSDAAAAVGASNMLINCMIGFFSGLSVGVGVTVGKAAGAGDEDRLYRLIHTSAAMALLFVLVLTTLGLTLSPSILEAMHTPTDIMPESVAYIRIYMLSTFSIVSFNIGSGILKALGNSRSPMLYQLGGGIANIIGNWLFIGAFRLDKTPGSTRGE